MKQTLALWREKPAHALLDFLGLLAAVYFVIIALQMAQHVTLFNMILLVVFSIVMLRVFYELVFNRDKVPTITSGFFERRRVAEILRKEVEQRGLPDFTILDMGSGRGELTRHIAGALPGAKVIGLETSYFPFHQARFLQRLYGMKNLEYRREDFLTYDCSGAHAVVLYLNDTMLKRIGPKLHAELKPGTLVVSNTFKLPEPWQPIETLLPHTLLETTLRIYRREI